MPFFELVSKLVNAVTFLAQLELPHTADNLGLVSPDGRHLLSELHIKLDTDAAVTMGKATDLLAVEDGDVANQADEVAVQVGSGMLDLS